MNNFFELVGEFVAGVCTFIAGIIVGVVLIILGGAIMAIPVMILWNNVIPNILGLGSIT